MQMMDSTSIYETILQQDNQIEMIKQHNKPTSSTQSARNKVNPGSRPCKSRPVSQPKSNSHVGGSSEWMEMDPSMEGRKSDFCQVTLVDGHMARVVVDSRRQYRWCCAVLSVKPVIVPSIQAHPITPPLLPLPFLSSFLSTFLSPNSPPCLLASNYALSPIDSRAKTTHIEQVDLAAPPSAIQRNIRPCTRALSARVVIVRCRRRRLYTRRPLEFESRDVGPALSCPCSISHRPTSAGLVHLPIIAAFDHFCLQSFTSTTALSQSLSGF